MICSPSKFLYMCLAGLSINYAIHNQQPATPPESRPILHHKLAVAVNQQPKAKMDSLTFVGFFRRYPLMTTYKENVKSFYNKRNYTCAWFEGNHLVEQATIWTNRLLNLENEGVYKHFSYQKNLDSLIDEMKIKPGKKAPDMDLELLLTCSYFEYSKLVWNGMDIAASRSANWLIPRKAITYDQYLDSILQTPVDRPSPRGPVYHQYEC